MDFKFAGMIPLTFWGIPPEFVRVRFIPWEDLILSLLAPCFQSIVNVCDLSFSMPEQFEGSEIRSCSSHIWKLHSRLNSKPQHLSANKV